MRFPSLNKKEILPPAIGVGFHKYGAAQDDTVTRQPRWYGCQSNSTGRNFSIKRALLARCSLMACVVLNNPKAVGKAL